MAEAKKKSTAKGEVKKKKVKVPAPAPLAEAPAVPRPVIVKKAAQPKVQLPKEQRFYGTGRRKEAVARVWLCPGSGKVVVNNKAQNDYFCNRKLLEVQIEKPFEVTKTAGRYDVFAEVFGGGVPSQATALSLGLARALVRMNPEFKVLLKRVGLLTRDPRMKERKKYGLKRARKAFQYTKR